MQFHRLLGFGKSFRAGRGLTLLCILALLTTGCAPEPQGEAAPLGSEQALARLATAFTAESDKFVSSPRSLPPLEKRRFVDQLFENAGYSYSKTLEAVAGDSALDTTDKLHRDLVELLFFPTIGVAAEDMSELFSNDELSHLNAIKAATRR